MAGEWPHDGAPALDDLRSDDPHPLAAQFYLQTLDDPESRNFAQVWADLPSDDRRAVGAHGDILALKAQGRGATALDRYPPEAPSLRADAFVYYTLSEIALQHGRPELQERYLVAGLEQFPGNFQLAYNLLIDTHSTADLAIWAEALERNPHWASLPIGEIIELRLNGSRHTVPHLQDRLDRTQAWLDIYPNDARALSSLAWLRRALGDRHSSRELYRRSHAAFPVYANPQQMRAEILFEPFLDENVTASDAEARVKDIMQYLHSMPLLAGETLDQKQRRLLASAYRDIGALGSAERVLAFGEGDVDALLMRDAAALLEKANGRHVQRAEHLEASFDIAESLGSDPRNMRNRAKLLVEAYLDAGRASDAAALRPLIEDTPEMTVDDHVLISRILDATDPEATRDWLDAAIASAPGSPELWDRVVKNRSGEALSDLRMRETAAMSAFTLAPTSARAKTWIAAHQSFAEASDPRRAPERHKAWLREHVAAYPLILDFQDALFGNGDADQKALDAQWDSLLEKYPDNHNMRSASIDRFAARRDWDGLQQALDGYASMAERSGSRAARVNYLENLAFYTNSLATRNEVGPDEVRAARDAIEELREAGAMHQYYRFQEMLSARLNDPEARADALLQRSRLKPFDLVIFHDLVAEQSLSDSLTPARTFGYGYRMVLEKPYGADFYDRFIHKHVLWGGSPVVALWAMDKAERNGLSVKRFEARALGQLGDPVTRYDRGFKTNYWGTGSSQNYVNWHDDAARKVRESKPNNFEYDFGPDTAAVEIRKPDGEVIIRHDDVRIGKTTRLSRGGVTYDMGYTPAGRLSTITGPQGELFKADYTDGKVTRLSVSGDTSEIFYNEQGEISVLHVLGRGALSITYDDDGEIDSIETLDEFAVTKPDGGTFQGYEITEIYQRALSLINALDASLKRGEFPNLAGDTETEANEALVLAFEEARQVAIMRLMNDAVETTLDERHYAWSDAEVRRTAAALNAYQRANLSNSGDYLTDTLYRLQEQILAARDLSSTDDMQQAGASALGEWLTLKTRQKPNGVTGEEYGFWSESYDWLARVSGRGKDATVPSSVFARLRAWFGGLFRGGHIRALESAHDALDAETISLLGNQRWLPESAMSNDMQWRRTDLSVLLPVWARNADVLSTLMRADGRVVVGTSQGLLEKSENGWRFYGIDKSTGHFTLSPDATGANDPRARVQALYETSDAELFIGTTAGLGRYASLTDAPLQRWETEQQGLAEPSIQTLHGFDNRLYVGTMSGLYVLDTADAPVLEPTPLTGDRIRSVMTYWETVPDDAAPDSETGDDPAESVGLLVSTDAGLFKLDETGTRPFHDKPVDDVACADFFCETLIALRDRRVLQTKLGYGDAVAAFRSLPGQDEIRHTARLDRLLYTNVVEPGGDMREAVAVLGDQGVAYWSDWHFEFAELPLAATRGDVVLGPAAAMDGPLGPIFFTTEAIYEYGTTRANYLDATVTDILNVPEWDLTLLAAGSKGLVVFDPATADIVTLNDLNPAKLARFDEDTVVMDDGGVIVAVDLMTQSRTDLFDIGAWRETPDDWKRDNRVRSLLVADDKTIWVAQGSTLYRKPVGAPVEVFNYVLTPETFPTRARDLSKVWQMPDGSIWVSASNDAYNDYKGVALRGGLFRYDGSKFVRQDDANARLSLVTGVTPLADGQVVLGTSNYFMTTRVVDDKIVKGFGGDSAGMNASHEELRKTRRLWLGGDGVAMGDDVMLYPTVDGVAVDHHGAWFMLDGLNSLLPDDVRYGQYGGRRILALGVDDHGTIFASTEQGTLIAQPEGGLDGLLAASGRGQDVFAFREVDRASAMADVFAPNTNPDSEEGRLIRRIRALEAEIEKAQIEAVQGETRKASSSGPASSASAGANSTDRRTGGSDAFARIKARDEERLRLLAKLEETSPGLFQVLTLDPREVSNLGEKLGRNDLIVQYIPGGDSLVVQLTSAREGSVTVSIPVDTQRLSDSAETVQQALAARAARLSSPDRGDASPLTGSQPIVQELAWLYDALLRPIEGKLAEFDTIYLVPYDQLLPLPFDALVRRVEPRVEYAVESFHFSTLSSVSLINLATDAAVSSPDRALLIGNPDATLSHAEDEVKSIEPYFADSTTLIRGQASLSAVSSAMPRHGVLHFATHGRLDYEAPSKSYLVMASGERLGVIDVSVMDLRSTRVAVLSACETGVGSSGLEYATLARAFAHARVPSTIASLWSVDDGATETLMIGFYRHFKSTDNLSSALAQTKRDMIASGGTDALPESWASMVLFGKP